MSCPSLLLLTHRVVFQGKVRAGFMNLVQVEPPAESEVALESRETEANAIQVPVHDQVQLDEGIRLPQVLVVGYPLVPIVRGTGSVEGPAA